MLGAITHHLARKAASWFSFSLRPTPTWFFSMALPGSHRDLFDLSSLRRRALGTPLTGIALPLSRKTELMDE
jgi:hypothetical protein